MSEIETELSGADQALYDRIVENHRRWRRGAIAGYVAIVIAVGVGFHLLGQLTNKSTDVNCALAGLIAHVPAIPYDEETIDNFRGWVSSRATLVQEAGIEEDCDPEIVEALQVQVENDRVLLEQLEQKVGSE